jgi:hypothetical protein
MDQETGACPVDLVLDFGNISYIHMHYEESLNSVSDGHQFHQYFKKKLSPVLLTEPTVHKKDHGI